MSFRMMRSALLISATFLAGTVPGVATSPQPGNTSESRPFTFRAQDVIDALSFSTHITYTDSAYGNTSKVISAMKWLGVGRARDQMPLFPPNDPRLQYYYKMMAAGIRLSLVSPNSPAYTAGYPSIVAAMKANLDTVVGKYPGKVVGIEGLNEPDLLNDGYIYTYGSLAGPQAVGQFQVDLYAMAKADPLLAAIPVWQFSLNSRPWNQTSWESVYAAVPAAMQAFDLTSKGTYGGYWSPEFQLKQQMIYPYDAYFTSASANTVAYGPYNPAVANLPMGIKETGLQGANPAIPSVNVPDYTIQAKMFLDDILDSFILGASVVNIYELADVYPDPSNSSVFFHYGMFDSNWNAKPVAYVVKNFVAALSDTGATARTFTPTRLNVTVHQFPIAFPGVAPSGHFLETEKSDGSYAIVLWYEPKLVGATSAIDLPAPAPTPITVGFSQLCASATVYDPYLNTTTVAPDHVWFTPVSLPDHPVILTCKPV